MKIVYFSLISFFLTVMILQSSSVSSQNLPKWGLVFSGEPEYKNAQTEIDRFNGNNMDTQILKYRNKAAIFYRNNMFRSVLLFDSEDEAKNARDAVEKYLNAQDKAYQDSINKRQGTNKVPTPRNSYTVNLGRWCPGWFIKKKNKNNYPNKGNKYPYFECYSQPSY